MNTPVPGADHPSAKGVHPGPVGVGVTGRPGRGGGGGWISKLQATKTLIEPRLELPGPPGRVSELSGDEVPLTTSMQT